MPLTPAALARLLRGDDRAVRATLLEAGDLGEVLARARAEGVGGLVVDRLRTAGALPPALEQRERMRDVEAGLWLDRASQALARACAGLDACGVRSLTLKGPALAERLYAEAPQHRLSIDLDLLVAPGDLERAAAALAPLGWTRDGGGWDRYLARHHHAVHLAHPAEPPIDLHFSASVGLGAPLAAGPLLARAVEHRLASGATVRVPSPEDELVYLAVHAVSHRLGRLVWLADIARLVARASPDVGVALARAREARLEGPLLVAARAVERHFGARIPGLAPSTLRGRARVGAALALASAPVHAAGALDSAVTFAVATLSCDRPRDALAFAGNKVRRVAERVVRFRALRIRQTL